jgi:hypothetical protein
MNSNWVIGFADYWIVGLNPSIEAAFPPLRVAVFSACMATGFPRRRLAASATIPRRAIHQSINPSIHQSINPSIHQSINPSTCPAGPESKIDNPKSP